MRTIAFLTLASLVAGGTASAQDATKSAAPARAKAPPHATVTILEPRNGAHVGQDLLVKFGARNVSVASATDAAPGTGHHHLLIDEKELPPLDAPIPNDTTHKHYGKGQTQDTIHLEPGDHTLQLDFADATHMQFNPPIVSKKITVHVK